MKEENSDITHVTIKRHREESYITRPAVLERRSTINNDSIKAWKT